MSDLFYLYIFVSYLFVFGIIFQNWNDSTDSQKRGAVITLLLAPIFAPIFAPILAGIIISDDD